MSLSRRYPSHGSCGKLSASATRPPKLATPISAATRRRSWNGSARHIAIASGTLASVTAAATHRRFGNSANRKASASVSTIMMSTKFAVICSTSYLKRDRMKSEREQRERQQARQARPAQQHQPEGVERDPGQHEGDARDEIGLGERHQQQRAEDAARRRARCAMPDAREGRLRRHSLKRTGLRQAAPWPLRKPTGTLAPSMADEAHPPVQPRPGPQDCHKTVVVASARRNISVMKKVSQRPIVSATFLNTPSDFAAQSKNGPHEAGRQGLQRHCRARPGNPAFFEDMRDARIKSLSTRAFALIP